MEKRDGWFAYFLIGYFQHEDFALLQNSDEIVEHSIITNNTVLYLECLLFLLYTEMHLISFKWSIFLKLR